MPSAAEDPYRNDDGTFRSKAEVAAEMQSTGGAAASDPSRNEDGTFKAGASQASNPGNFANRPKEEVQEIAREGGKASHGGQSTKGTSGSTSEATGSAAADPGRNSDGTFKSSSASDAASDPGRNPDGTFTSANPGSFANRPKEEVQEIAREGGKVSHGGQSTTGASSSTDAAGPQRNADGTFASTTDSSSPSDAASDPSRNPDGTWKAGSSATNPDNFANRPTKEVQAIAHEGGKHSHDNV